MDDFPVLCGCTFFSLLLQAAKPDLNKRDSGWGGCSSFTESDVFEALIKIVNPNFSKSEYGDNFKTSVSAYKNGNCSKKSCFSITDQVTVADFDNRIKTEYNKVASMMNSLVDSYLDASKGTWLVEALLELISNDASIKKTDNFYIQLHGEKYAKVYLTGLSNICMPTFLLGIWHYIIINRPDNSIGKATYDEWHASGSTKNAKKTFISKIGTGKTRKIVLVPFQNSSADMVEAEIVSDTTDDTASIHNSDSASNAAISQTAELKFAQNSLVIHVGGSNNSIGTIINNQTINNNKGTA